ncbi:MAG: family 43 glycosylhydrolase, partial [Candidatus Scatosoma sp.]
MKKNLFYRNDFSSVPSAADSFILYDGGWFYLYFTEVKNGTMKAYKSRDCAAWEDIGVIYQCDERYWANGRFWCPRVMKYPKDGKYYLYCASSGETEIGLPEGTSLDKKSPVFANIIKDRLHLSVLVSDSPEGPFKEWTGKRKIEKFYHGKSLGVIEEEVTLSSGPIFDFANAPAGWQTNQEHFARNGTNVFAQLDPCPFIDDDGTLYLYFVRSRDMNDNKHKHGCWGVKMIDPVTPDYHTLAFLAQPGYYTVGGEPAPSAIDDDIINEGAFMQKHTT